jgi:hypothetical protein
VTGVTGAAGVDTFALTGVAVVVDPLSADADSPSAVDDLDFALVVTAVGAAAGRIRCFAIFAVAGRCASDRDIPALCLTTCVARRRLVPTGVA